MNKCIWFLAYAGLIIALTTLATDVFPQMDQTSSSTVTGITSGRAKSLVGGVFGLASFIIGWKAKARKRRWVITALTLGVIAILLGVIHLVNVTGGFGTGGGKAGAIVAVALGLVGCLLNLNALRIKRA